MSINIDSKEYKIVETKLGTLGNMLKLEKDNKYYVLKKISIADLTNEEIELTKEKYKILSKINNEYIVKYYHYYIENDYLNILREYAGNSNLKKFIKNYKEKEELIKENIIENIIRQICIGLKDIHKNKIIHRDLTPENIFIDENNKIKIGDFGVSIIFNNKYKYEDKDIIGSFHYIAPEIDEENIYDYKSDIYSLGCIIYELFTLNEYYYNYNYNPDDTLLDIKEFKIDTKIYNPKWDELLDLLLKKDYNERPTVEEVFNKYIKRNEINLSVKIDKHDINKQIYFIDNLDDHNHLREMNESNTILYINDIKNKFNKYFIPEKEGIYIIKLIFNFSFNDCSYMFYNCTNIINIDLYSFDTKDVTNMSYMFYDCCNISNIDLSSFKTRNVKDMSYIFKGCRNLENINLTSFNTGNVINMKNMFCYCDKIKSINLFSFNTENVTNMSCMFYHCSNLDNLDLSSFNINKITNMDYMFGNCSNLEKVDLTSFNSNSVIDMCYMFCDCSKINSIDLSSFTNNFDDVSMFGIFTHCKELVKLKSNKSFHDKMLKDNPYYEQTKYNKEGFLFDK